MVYSSNLIDIPLIRILHLSSVSTWNNLHGGRKHKRTPCIKSLTDEFEARREKNKCSCMTLCTNQHFLDVSVECRWLNLEDRIPYNVLVSRCKCSTKKWWWISCASKNATSQLKVLNYAQFAATNRSGPNLPGTVEFEWSTSMEGICNSVIRHEICQIIYANAVWKLSIWKEIK